MIREVLLKSAPNILSVALLTGVLIPALRSCKQRRLPELRLLTNDDERREVWRAAHFWPDVLNAHVLLIASAAIVFFSPMICPSFESFLAGLQTRLRAPLNLILNGAGLIGMCGVSLLFTRLLRRPLTRALRIQLWAHALPVCMRCGYSLRGRATPHCPECGWTLPLDACPACHGTGRLGPLGRLCVGIFLTVLTAAVILLTLSYPDRSSQRVPFIIVAFFLSPPIAAAFVFFIRWLRLRRALCRSCAGTGRTPFPIAFDSPAPASPAS